MRGKKMRFLSAALVAVMAGGLVLSGCSERATQAEKLRLRSCSINGSSYLF